MTIFQKIINKEIAAEIVYEDAEVLAFRDIAPIAPVHILFIPKTPIKDVLEASLHEGLMSKLFLAIHKYVKEANIPEDQIRIVTNCGAKAGQSVFHFHLHLLAGREFKWPPG